MAKILNLVRNKKLKIAYPKGPLDFEVLRKLGLSIKFCKVDFLPLLRVAASNKNVSLVIEDFDELEAKAVSSLQKKWPGEVSFSKKSLALSCIRDEAHFVMMKSVRQALTKFYQAHGMRLDYTIKRRSKAVTVTFTKTVQSSVFVVDDER